MLKGITPQGNSQVSFSSARVTGPWKKTENLSRLFSYRDDSLWRMTNAVAKESEIETPTLRGRLCNIPYVDIIGVDVDKDLLILKIKGKKFPAVKIGNSKSLNVGQRVYAIGSPMGLENSISEGIISGLRSYDELRRSFIQITASISPGSSGGAVVNDKGELIGISTLTFKQGQNLNFAIPIEDILKVKK